MKKELQDKLYKDFPDLYCQKDLSIQESCMPWGIETDDGWFDMIYELSEKIVNIDPECQAVQVKEKFGGLRFYTGQCDESTYDRVQDLISEYEEKSYQICEECGITEGVTQTQGWIKTLCPKCMEKRNGVPVETKSVMKRLKIQRGE